MADDFCACEAATRKRGMGSVSAKEDAAAESPVGECTPWNSTHLFVSTSIDSEGEQKQTQDEGRSSVKRSPLRRTARQCVEEIMEKNRADVHTVERRSMLHGNTSGVECAVRFCSCFAERLISTASEEWRETGVALAPPPRQTPRSTLRTATTNASCQHKPCPTNEYVECQCTAPSSSATLPSSSSLTSAPRRITLIAGP